MIEKRKHEQLMTCDMFEAEVIYAKNFRGLIIDAKEAGWKITRTSERFLHICPDCQAQGWEFVREG